MANYTMTAEHKGRAPSIRRRRFGGPSRRRWHHAGLLLLSIGLLSLIYALAVNRYMMKEGSKYILGNGAQTDDKK